MSLPDFEKEKIKLRATFINGMAIGVVLVGVFTPITRAAYDPAMTGDAFFFMAASALVCFALGFLLLLCDETSGWIEPMTIYAWLSLLIPVVGIAAVLLLLRLQDRRSLHPGE